MTSSVKRMKEALEKVGLRIYAPRAGIFLDVDEAVSVVGIFLHIFGMPERSEYQGRELEKFHAWLDRCYQRGQEMISQDRPLARYVAERVNEIETVINDYLNLLKTVESNGWQLDGHYQPELMRPRLIKTGGISERARRHLGNQYMNRVIEERSSKGRPFSLSYIINAATALDWNILDLFYRIIGFDSFKGWFEAAESGEDEGPVCNLGIVSQYLASFLEKFSSILSAGYLQRDKFHRQFFNIYLYSLHRRGESEYEDVDDPFPKGRIPFLTVHQSKGLEFPVVILGNLNRRDRLQDMEGIVHPLLDRSGEPLDRSPQFDNMRIFYVAMSRAQNLLVLPQPSGMGQHVYQAFTDLLNGGITRLPNFDVRAVPEYKEVSQDIPRTYSYT
ncbi:MAG: 3'-5' exonuclease, partial [Acidobacteriota bacterium]